jgi:hypothetical protein
MAAMISGICPIDAVVAHHLGIGGQRAAGHGRPRNHGSTIFASGGVK